jgi:GAF domain-containing protein
MTTGALGIDEIERLQARVGTLEQERKHLLAVIEILQDIGGSLHFADIVRSVTLRLGETFGLDRCSIFLAERGGESVRLVASYEDPGIRNYAVNLDRYPELRLALQTGQTVFIADAATDPSLGPARWALAARKVKTITVIPISWRGAAIGAIFLRTFRDGPSFSAADLEFCQVVANLTAKALRNAHRFERMRERRGEDEALRRREGEQAALLGFLRRLLASTPAVSTLEGDPPSDPAESPEIERLVGVALAVLNQESASR